VSSCSITQRTFVFLTCLRWPIFTVSILPSNFSISFSLHDALPIYPDVVGNTPAQTAKHKATLWADYYATDKLTLNAGVRYEDGRSEEHTSELQSRFDLVCRLLLV